MIIRPFCKSNYIVIPNALLNDKRLSADTRAMLALLLSKPRGWQLRPKPLRKLLSREGEAEVGWTRLRRMFSEATAAGYMARSEKQQHEQDGTWGKYEYLVGMPDDVLRAVQKENVELAPQSRGTHEDEPRPENDFTNHKERTSKKTESINPSPTSPLLHTLGRNRRELSIEGGKRSARKRPERPEVVQHRVAVRLGNGDARMGWLLLGALSPSRRDQLTAMERQGRLGEAELVDARTTAVLVQISDQGGLP